MIQNKPNITTLLLVDDSPTNLRVLSESLDNLGWEILVAKDGYAAIEQAESSKPDLILLDVMMPKMDGFETCQRLKNNSATNDIPIIFMTALSDPVDKVNGLQLGAVDYITKPFQQEEVLARIKLHLKLHSLTKQYAKQNQLLKQEIAERIAAESALQKLTLELEQRVEERTAELKKALQNLQQAQIQLVQKEKMSTLGQLVAGVAHEINNPLTFISGNLAHGEQAVQHIINHLRLYQKKFPDPGCEIYQNAEHNDIEYLLEDLPNLISSMRIGSDRIRNISVSLRNFSRLDTASKVKANIHEGLDSTLLILKYRLSAKENRPAIEVIKNYGSLPLVECYAGQLNQVFMNIIANAIDALEETNVGRSYEEIKGNPNKIIIHTYLLEENKGVGISIEDNGPGISDEVMQHLFEPLFTTKPVGFGTGLGLSISYSVVVEKHGGQIKCVSTPGEGSKFTIEIPIY